MPGGARIGIDVGGTFTDLIYLGSDGSIVMDKTPSTLDDQSRGVMTGLGQLADRAGVDLATFCREVDLIVHGTTTADNTMIETDGAQVGLLVTEGHRDEIEMRRVHKEQIWDPAYPAPFPIARRRHRIPIAERMDHNGQVLLDLDIDAVRAGVRRLRAMGCDSLAIMFLFSYVNPDHERAAATIVAEEWPELGHLSLSHQVMAKGPEFERVSTTLVNAYVAPRIARYLGNLTDRLADAGFGGQVLVMTSTGGVMPPASVSRRAVTLLGSGPTGGVIGSARAALAADTPDFVAVDMGGTSYDMCLVRGGVPEVSSDWNWRYRYYIGMPMVDVQCIGAGGGSIARVREGALLVGPESAGSSPGPCCYGQGGDRPTVTDADVVLGYLPTVGFAGGRMTLDVEAARSAIATHVADPLEIDVVDAAWGIERIVNANMANATRRVLASVGADARQLAMIAYGGNGPVHAWAIARELGMRRVLVPKAAPAFSALGLLVSDYKVDLTRSSVVPLSSADLGTLAGLADELRAEADTELAPTGLSDAEIVIDVSVLMSYAGQNFDLSVPAPVDLAGAQLSDLADRFHEQHEAERGFAFRNQPPVIRGVRLVAQGLTAKPESLAALGDVTDASLARTGQRPVFFGDGFVDTTLIDGTVLGAGATVDGPALIGEAFTVVVVPPGATATLGAHGSYVIDL